MKIKIALSLFAGAVLSLGGLSACAESMEEEQEVKKSQFAIETEHIQIGCCWKTGSYPYPEKRKWNTRPWFRIGFPFWWNNYENTEVAGVNGVVLSPLANFDGGINGVAIAPVFFVDECTGVVLAPLLSVPACLNGVSFASINFCTDGNSVQIGSVNWRGAWGRLSGQEKNGIAQIGVFNKDFWGINTQIGVVNDSGNIPYLQIGLVNMADCTGQTSRSGTNGKVSDVEKEKHFALQAGLWNSNGRRSFPFLNVTW